MFATMPENVYSAGLLIKPVKQICRAVSVSS